MVISFCSHLPLLSLIIKKYLPTFFERKKTGHTKSPLTNYQVEVYQTLRRDTFVHAGAIQTQTFCHVKTYHELNVGISKIVFFDISTETLYCLKDTNVSFKSTQFDRVSSQKDKLICQTD